MIRKTVYVIIIGLLIAVAVPVQARQGETYTLGLSLPSLSGAFFEVMTESAQFTADEAGANLIVVGADYDVEAELANVQDLIDQGIDALLFDPSDPVASVDAIALANEAGVPVFVLGDLVLNEDSGVDIAGHIVTNNTEAGQFVGGAVCEALEETGAVLKIVALDDDPMSIMAARSESFEAYMAQSCTGVSITPVNVIDLSFDDALDSILAALDEADYDALVSLDDQTTLLAVSANDIFRAKNLAVVGVGSHPDLSSSLEQEKVTAIILAEPIPMGQTSVQTSLAYLNGEEVELTVEAILTTLNADNVNQMRCLPWDNSRNC